MNIHHLRFGFGVLLIIIKGYIKEHHIYNNNKNKKNIHIAM